MKNSFLFGLMFLIFSCGEEPAKKTETISEPYKAENSANKFDDQRLIGRYTGKFGKAMIILQIDYIQGKNASGFNIVRGNRRNIKGSVESKGAAYHFILQEPGDDKYDGVFEFDIDTSTLVLKGKWTPNDTTQATMKEFTFDKMVVNEQSNIEGFYSGNVGDVHGMLEIKKNGTCIFKTSIEKKLPDGNYDWEEYPIYGSWIEKGNQITLEFEKNPYLQFYRVTLTNESEEYGDYLNGGDNASFYSGM